MIPQGDPRGNVYATVKPRPGNIKQEVRINRHRFLARTQPCDNNKVMELVTSLP